MSPRAGRALALAALTLLPLLPVANAGGPTPTPWTPYDAHNGVTALAISARGTTIAAATTKPTNVSAPPVPTPTIPSCDPGPPPSCTGLPSPSPSTPNPGDLAILEQSFYRVRYALGQSAS